MKAMNITVMKMVMLAAVVKMVMSASSLFAAEAEFVDVEIARSSPKNFMLGPAPGSEDNPWKVGKSETDTVAAYTNGKGRLEIIGAGAMMDFDPSAPWASNALTECVVASNVTAIGKNAFANCEGLKTLVVSAEVPPVLGAGNDLAGVKIFVPAGKTETYRANAQWMASKGTIDEMCTEKGEPLAKHLYEMTYNWWDATKANEIGENLAALMETIAWLKELYEYFFPYETFDWYEDFGGIPSALCTSCRNGNFVGRNFDWGYDDVDECVMHVPAAEGRLASVGIASWFFPQWLQDLVDVDAFLPELTMDGVNERGVAINVNVVPGGDNGWTEGTNPGGKRLCAGFAVRAVLDNATNAAHAVEILQSRDIYSLKPLEFHWMVSDETESYIVECVSNALVVLKAKEAQPKMANFYVSHSPNVGEYDILTNADLTAGVHTPHAMGIERYANVSNGLESVDSVEAMFTRMSNVWYKAKYLPGNEEKYWSDLNGSPVPGKDDERFEVGDEANYRDLRLDAFKALQANYVAVTNYEAQYGIRDTLEHDPSLTNQIVHTVHTSVYDIEKRKLRVVVQEDVETMHDVYLMPGAEFSPWEVGGEDEDPTKVVEAWTNGTELVFQGAGTVTNLTAIPSAIRGGITAITIVDATVTGVAPGVFAGLGNFNLALPDGWQGELPDEEGDWYGATFVTLTAYPLTVRNVRSQQRYPWNGLVDVSCDLTGEGEVTLSVTVRANGGDFFAIPILEGVPTVDLDAAGGVTNGVKFTWDAKDCCPAGFNAADAKITVTAMPTLATAPVVSAESGVFAFDLHESVALAEGAVTVSGVSYSDMAWGSADETQVTLGYTNVDTGATGVLAEGLTGENVANVELPKKDGVYRLTHSTGDLVSFVTFTVSGYPTLKIPAAGAHYTYVVSNETTEIAGELADGTNNYTVAKGATVKVYFTLAENYEWDGDVTNPKEIGPIEADTVIDAGDLPTAVRMVSYTQVAATEALEFTVDSRTGERVIDGSAAETLAYSAVGWDKGAAGPATISYTLNGGASETFAQDLAGDGGTNWQPKVNGTFAFTHTPGDAEGPLAATFIVSGLTHTLTIAQTNALTCVVSNETGVITGENGVYTINAGDKIWVVFDTTEDYHFTGPAPAPTVYDVFDGDVTIAEGDLPETEKYGDLFFGLVRAAQRYPWNGKVDIVFAVTNLRPTVEYALATAFTVKDADFTKAQTNDLPAVWRADGIHTNTVNVADASWFGAESLTNAPSKLSVKLLRE